MCVVHLFPSEYFFAHLWHVNERPPVDGDAHQAEEGHRRVAVEEHGKDLGRDSPIYKHYS
jgi:hypothetical protein